MTDDFLRYGTLGGAYAGNPEQIASLFEKQDVRLVSDGPWEITYLGDRKERWPSALDYISHSVGLFRQWAYRRADGNSLLLQEIDGYVSDLYKWLKEGRENGRLDDIELERLKAFKEALTHKLYEYVPERLLSGGLASVEQLLADIENTEHVERYPPGASEKWYDAEIVRLCLLSERIKLLRRLVEKVHPETADKYDYLHYLGEVVGDIASHIGLLKLSRDELYASVGTGKVDLQEHLSKIEGEIDNARRRINNHFLDLRERLAASKPLATSEIVRAFEQYALSKDTSVLPPTRQLHNALRKLKEPTPKDRSTLADFIVALGRHINSGAGYDCGLFDQFSITEVLDEMAHLDTGTANGPGREGENGGAQLSFNIQNSTIIMAGDSATINIDQHREYIANLRETVAALPDDSPMFAKVAKKTALDIIGGAMKDVAKGQVKEAAKQVCELVKDLGPVIMQTAAYVALKGYLGQ